MSVAIFVFGVLVFLITVYGTVVTGGLFLTGRQLDEQPELAASPEGRSDGSTSEKSQSFVPDDY